MFQIQENYIYLRNIKGPDRRIKGGVLPTESVHVSWQNEMAHTGNCADIQNVLRVCPCSPEFTELGTLAGLWKYLLVVVALFSLTLFPQAGKGKWD